MAILGSFRGELGFLSNFSDHPVGVIIDGIRYDFANNEAYFQAMKSTNPEDWRRFSNMTAGESKKQGRLLKLRDDWDQVKYDIMLVGLRSKFMNEEARNKLLATADMELVEENNWGDITWGVSNVTQYFKKHGRVVQRGEGQNWLGRLLMQVRQEIKEELNHGRGTKTTELS